MEAAAHSAGVHTERTRIARELHDTLLQGSQGMILQLQGIADKVAQGDPELGSAMEATLERANDSVTEARERVRELRRSEPVADTDLAAAIAQLGEELGADRPARFSMTLAGHSRRVPREVGDHVMAIVREALVNAFNHADARQVRVSLDYQRRQLVLEVQDDGRGIPQDVLARGSRPGHWGIAGMRERALAIGASLAVDSVPGEFTRIRVSLSWVRAAGSRWGLPVRWPGRRREAESA